MTDDEVGGSRGPGGAGGLGVVGGVGGGSDERWFVKKPTKRILLSFWFSGFFSTL
jgi:hypothetical protein